ncbi:MAG: hypothetical protein KGK03_10600 [Candidatus Omnitrophica bacterium]|nr:hypothetical protein [Candidatus Omnitrophota bacterium]
MIRYVLIILLILPSFSLSALARDPDAKLKSEYGNDLTHVPFFLRYSFLKTYNKDWYNSLYTERLDFLRDYETNVAAQKARDKAEAAQAAAEQKNRENEQKMILAKEKARKKAELDEEKDEQKAADLRQKSLDQMVAAQNKSLAAMEREMLQQEHR